MIFKSRIHTKILKMVTTSFKLNNGLQMPALGLGMTLTRFIHCEIRRGADVFHGGGGAI